MFSVANKIKEWFIAYKKTPIARELSFHNFRSAGSCLVLAVENDALMESVLEIKRTMAVHMVTDLLILRKKLRHKPEIFHDTEYISIEDITFDGKFKNERHREMIGNAYDLFIDLSRGEDNLRDFIIKSSPARCKIGMGRPGFQCDIVFDGVSKVEEFQEYLVNLLDSNYF